RNSSLQASSLDDSHSLEPQISDSGGQAENVGDSGGALGCQSMAPTTYLQLVGIALAGLGRRRRHKL
ncbi:MAG: hypothetical protein KDA51_19480, partial [Planctomycetales bacterium]|nr:hypothetical protein [Planctomycetales bacterium]